MTAVVLIGRTSSSFAAEIGTMKINQEVDALITMGINPIKFLAITRVIATTLMTPLLSVFLILFGLIGCGIVMRTLGYNLDIFLHQLVDTFEECFVTENGKTFYRGVGSNRETFDSYQDVLNTMEKDGYFPGVYHQTYYGDISPYNPEEWDHLQ